MTTTSTATADPYGLTVDVTSPTAVEDAVAKLRKYGVACIPGLVAGVAEMGAEFDAAFSGEMEDAAPLNERGKNLSRRHGQTVTGTHLKLDNVPRLRATNPAMHRTFAAPLMRDIAQGYLGLHTFNRHIILTHDFRAADPIIPFHFDELRALKFLVYLDDVDEDNGPFEAIPGTHRQGRAVREHEWLRTDSYNEVRNRIFEHFSEEFFYAMFGDFKQSLAMRRATFTGPAGTLVVFDTDVIHRGGPLRPGRSRRVARGSTYTGFWPSGDGAPASAGIMATENA